MIIPNLLCSNIASSVSFYCTKLGLELEFSVSRNRDVSMGEPLANDPVFAVLKWNDAQIMLQTAESLAMELPQFAGQQPTASGTIYFRDFDHDTALENLNADEILKGPELNWYGMNELYVRDPDGYVICLGKAKGQFQG